MCLCRPAVRKAFEAAGRRFVRQAGSHMIWVRLGSQVTLSVPDHHELAPGTLRAQIRAAGMTVADFGGAAGID